MERQYMLLKVFLKTKLCQACYSILVSGVEFCFACIAYQCENFMRQKTCKPFLSGRLNPMSLLQRKLVTPDCRRQTTHLLFPAQTLH